MVLSDLELINNYGTFLSGFRRKKTVVIYLFLLKHFIEYLYKNNKNLSNMKVEDVQKYIHSKSTWSNTAKIHFLTVLKSFLRNFYLNQLPVGVTNKELRTKLQKEMDIRTILSLPLLHKEVSSKNKSLSLENTKRLLEYAKTKNVDEYCLIYVLFYFGMRKSELMYINPTTEISWKENYLKITAEKSKTHSERILFFNDYTKSILIHILKTYGNKENLICKEDTFLNKIFYKYNRVVGVHLFPHMARHTFSTEQLKYIKGKINIDEVMAIKMLLGHVGDTTQIYTHYSNELKEIMIKYHYLQQKQKESLH